MSVIAIAVATMFAMFSMLAYAVDIINPDFQQMPIMSVAKEVSSS